MRVSVITPTCNRPVGIALCETYMRRQTVQPDEWVVADSGSDVAALTMGQIHLHREMPPGPRNLALNLLAALERVTGDVVVVIEDDDHYAPDHIERCIEGLRRAPAHGCPTLRYFNVTHRCWIEMRNKGSALCQTALRRELIPKMQAAAKAAHDADDFGIDARFWAPRQRMANGPQTVIGIKGLPGVAGLGIGHRPKPGTNRRWRDDPEFTVLREWIGADADAYVDLA